MRFTKVTPGLDEEEKRRFCAQRNRESALETNFSTATLKVKIDRFSELNRNKEHRFVFVDRDRDS